MRFLLRSRLLSALILVGLFGCNGGGEKKEDESKVPIEVKKAEMADSTRLDSAPDSAGGAVDSLTEDNGEQTRKLRFR